MIAGCCHQNEDDAICIIRFRKANREEGDGVYLAQPAALLQNANDDLLTCSHAKLMAGKAKAIWPVSAYG